MKKPLPRCVALAADGTRCGRRVSDKSNPPICHIHVKVAKGEAVSPLTEPAERSPMEILEKLMSDNDPAIRLRAVEAYLKNSEATCPRCAAREEVERNDMNVYTMRPDELEELDRLLLALDEFEARIKSTPRAADSRIEQENSYEQRIHPEPPHREAAVSVEAAESAAAKPRRRERQPDEEVKAPYELPKVLWEDAGLFELPETGVVTHPDGDEVAQKILSGEIPFEDAKRMAEAVTAKSKRMGGTSANIRSFS